MYALMLMMPYFMIIAMFYVTSVFSQLYEEYTVFFILGIAMLMTNMTGNFNLKSTVGAKYYPFYIDPIIFLGILYADYNNLLAIETIKIAYVSLAAFRFICYMLFLRGMANDLCNALGIPFWRVK
jgi:hypothetical protein